MFHLYPKLVFELATPNCIKSNYDHDQNALFGHCGYDQKVRTNIFLNLARLNQ